MQGVAGTVRRATPADIEDLRAVYGRSWRAAYGPFVDADQLDELGSRRVQRAAWSAAIRTSTCALFVGADPRGATVGFARVDAVLPEPRHLPEVTMLYVAPTAWGTGVAHELLAACTDWLTDRRHPRARLRVAQDHLRARRFYEREGWTLDRGSPSVPTDLTRLLVYERTLL